MSKVLFYINVFRDSGGRYSVSNPYAMLDKAVESGKLVRDYVRTVPIEFEED